MVVVIIIGVMFLAGSLLARNLRYRALATLNRSYASVVMFTLAALLVSDLLAGEGVFHRLPVDLALAVIPMTLLSGIFISQSQKKAVMTVFAVFSGMLALYYMLCVFGLCKVPLIYELRIIILSEACLYFIMSIWVIWGHLRNIHTLMQSGSVWTVLCLSVDVIYASVLQLLMVICSVTVHVPLLCVLVAFLMVAMLSALGCRMIMDSVFVLFRRHERRIVESMRISPVEPVPSNPGEDNVYKELFGRIQEYFDDEKPFLNGSLTINDIVTKVFSNKVYISRAIVQCTGRNFCQYVNYHRIMYAMECFRKNTELKISELWPLCGFNTIVSFNMAFRLFMDENPSEWCRKEKIRLSKKKK